MAVKYLITHYWKSLIFVTCILYLSFAPPSTFNGVPEFENEDKLVHLLLYAVLTCILIFDYRQYPGKRQMSGFSFILICIIIPIILGGAVEILQPLYFAPRTADWFDWFSDITGVFLGWVAFNLLKRRFFKKI